MLSSLLRPRRARPRVEEHSPFSSVYPDQDSSPIIARQERQIRHATADWTETEEGDDNTEDDEDGQDDGEDEAGDPEDADEDEDGDEDTPLLPIFSAAHLGE